MSHILAITENRSFHARGLSFPYRHPHFHDSALPFPTCNRNRGAYGIATATYRLKAETFPAFRLESAVVFHRKAQHSVGKRQLDIYSRCTGMFPGIANRLLHYTVDLESHGILDIIPRRIIGRRGVRDVNAVGCGMTPPA